MADQPPAWQFQPILDAVERANYCLVKATGAFDPGGNLPDDCQEWAESVERSLHTARRALTDAVMLIRQRQQPDESAPRPEREPCSMDEIARLRAELTRLQQAQETTALTAKAFFDADQFARLFEERMDDRLLEIIGVDPNDYAAWPIGCAIYDVYDYSFEFKGTNPEFVFTPEHWKVCAALGFARCWICYTDGTERYFANDYPNGTNPKESHSSDGRNYTDMKRLQRRLHAAEESLAQVTQERDDWKLAFEAAAPQEKLCPKCGKAFDLWRHDYQRRFNVCSTCGHEHEAGV